MPLQFAEITENIYNFAYKNQDEDYKLWYFIDEDSFPISLSELVNKIKYSRLAHKLTLFDDSYTKPSYTNFDRVYMDPVYNPINLFYLQLGASKIYVTECATHLELVKDRIEKELLDRRIDSSTKLYRCFFYNPPKPITEIVRMTGKVAKL